MSFLNGETPKLFKDIQCNCDGLPNLFWGYPIFQHHPTRFGSIARFPQRFWFPWAELCRTSPADPIIAAGCWSPERPQGILQTQSRALGVKTVGKWMFIPQFGMVFYMFRSMHSSSSSFKEFCLWRFEDPSLLNVGLAEIRWSAGEPIPVASWGRATPWIAETRRMRWETGSWRQLGCGIQHFLRSFPLK